MPVGNAKLNDLADAKTRRGFTDHEHLDDIELIHMNGRVYDYNLGRFMSVDPVIQSPTNSQSINPYSYIMNNPLAGIDPTGYCSTDDTLKDCARGLEERKVQAITDSNGRTVGQIGKDSQGTIHITNNGSSAGKAAIADVIKAVDIGSSSTIAKGNNSSSRDLYACTNCSDGSNSIDGVDMPEVIDEYWRERKDGENGYPSTEYLGSRELHHEGLYDGEPEILASGAFEIYLNETPRLGLSYNYDLPDAWRMRMPNIVFASEVKVNVYNVHVKWSIEKTPILDVKIYRQKIRMSSYSNVHKRTFVQTRWKYTKEVQQVDSKTQYFESRRRGGINQVQSWPIVP
jgi:RHS repeat-associated protein